MAPKDSPAVSIGTPLSAREDAELAIARAAHPRDRLLPDWVTAEAPSREQAEIGLMRQETVGEWADDDLEGTVVD